METTADQRELARRLAGLNPHDTRPVVVVPGWGAPEVRGVTYSWETPGGQPVRYVSAYRKARGNPVYVYSTRQVVVGERWLLARS